MASNLQLKASFKAHRKILDKHLEVWHGWQKTEVQSKQIQAVVRQCEEQTRRMLEQCISIEALISASEQIAAHNKKHERCEGIEVSARAKKARKTSETDDSDMIHDQIYPNTQKHEVTADPSGLFMIDSNPVSNVSALIDESEKRAKKLKRKLELESREEEDTEIPARDVLVPKSKKAKRAKITKEHEEKQGSLSDPKQSNHAESESEPEHAQATHSDQAQNKNNHDLEFERKVALRLKEKDEALKTKANKKRKRESDVSAADVSQAADEIKLDNEVTQAVPKKKKQKGKSSAAKDVPASSTSATNIAREPQKPAKRKKTKGEEGDGDGPAQTQDATQSNKPKKKKQKKSK